MSSINKLAVYNSEIKQVSRQQEDRKVRSQIKNSEAQQANQAVKTDISDESRELYKTSVDAARYTQLVGKAETLEPARLEEIRERLENNFYFDDKVIDTIVNKLLKLPSIK
jgi:HD-GYP domain-containing protein (c-di-GMP phosphodiesterase class II)